MRWSHEKCSSWTLNGKGVMMATLKDLYDTVISIRTAIELFEVSAEAKEKIIAETQASRDAVMEEQGLDDPEKAAALAEGTILGKKAEAALNNLRSLLSPR